MHQLKDILDSTTTEQIIHDHQQFLLKNQESQLVSSLSSFLQKERSSAREGIENVKQMLINNVCNIPHKDQLKIIENGMDDWASGRNIAIQIKKRIVNGDHTEHQGYDDVHLYLRVSAYAWLYFLEDTGKNIQPESQQLSEIIKHYIHSILRDEYGFHEISINDPMLKTPINIFGEFKGAQIYSAAHKKYMCNIPVNITLDSLVDRYMLASDDSEITSLSFEKKLGRAKEDFACILEKKITPHPILVNRENKIVLRQFNMWDLLFFEN